MKCKFFKERNTKNKIEKRDNSKCIKKDLNIKSHVDFFNYCSCLENENSQIILKEFAEDILKKDTTRGILWNMQYHLLISTLFLTVQSYKSIQALCEFILCENGRGGYLYRLYDYLESSGLYKEDISVAIKHYNIYIQFLISVDDESWALSCRTQLLSNLYRYFSFDILKDLFLYDESSRVNLYFNEYLNMDLNSMLEKSKKIVNEEGELNLNKNDIDFEDIGESGEKDDRSFMSFLENDNEGEIGEEYAKDFLENFDKELEEIVLSDLEVENKIKDIDLTGIESDGCFFDDDFDAIPENFDEIIKQKKYASLKRLSKETQWFVIKNIEKGQKNILLSVRGILLNRPGSTSRWTIKSLTDEFMEYYHVEEQYRSCMREIVKHSLKIAKKSKEEQRELDKILKEYELN